MKNTEQKRLDERLISFQGKLRDVAAFEPKDEYLYPVIRSVPFSDTETALDMAILNYKASLK